MIRKSFLPAIAFLMVCVGAQAQTCRDDILATAPDSRFRDNGNGTVTDLATNLIWKQCAEGQSGTGCATGTTSVFTWQQALQHADAHLFAGSTLWRLPNKKELASLVEQRCYYPALNSRFFTNMPWGIFWSSSPYASDSNFAWTVNFYYGAVENGFYKTNPLYVRLVRGGQ